MDEQLDALNRLIARIVGGNVFYRRKLASCGGEGGFESLEDYVGRMPFTTKEELSRDQEANPPYGSALTYPLERYTRVHQTSGTGGRPLVWMDDPESWQGLVENWKEVWCAAGARAGEGALFAFSFGPFLGFWTSFEAACQLGIRAYPGGGMSSADRVRALLTHPIAHLCCTPTYAMRLAEVAEAEGLPLGECGVERLMVAGEPGGSVPEVRARLEAAWPRARVFDHHGMTEVGPVSYQDPGRPNRLRLMHGAYLCEVVRPDSTVAVSPGETGELVLTTLKRVGSPLLRYRTGDLVRPVAIPGEDARAFALEGGILGRVDDMLIVRGVNVYPSAIDAVVRSVGGVTEYRVEVDRSRALPEVTIRIETAGDPGTVAELQKRLRTAFEMRMPVEVVPAGTLPRFEMKARRWHVVR
ncbi:MAG: phenylacetate--CoA ligase family protein [Verrucomicrobiae bacterium]|nr:phenylacetate--CoA ligase family protein [Verrucomicrobiae bacterium]